MFKLDNYSIYLINQLIKRIALGTSESEVYESKNGLTDQSEIYKTTKCTKFRFNGVNNKIQ